MPTERLHTKFVEQLVRGHVELTGREPGADELQNICYMVESIFICSDQYLVDYKERKRHVLDLLLNLRRDSNTELRTKLISGEMTPEQLVQSDLKSLAPKELREKRKADQDKYYKSAVILPSVAPTRIVKTHKGLELVPNTFETSDEVGIDTSAPTEEQKNMETIEEYTDIYTVPDEFKAYHHPIDPANDWGECLERLSSRLELYKNLNQESDKHWRINHRWQELSNTLIQSLTEYRNTIKEGTNQMRKY